MMKWNWKAGEFNLSYLYSGFMFNYCHMRNILVEFRADTGVSMKAINPLIPSIALFVVLFSCGGDNDVAEVYEVDEAVNIEAETESDQLYATVSIENGPGLRCEFTYANCSPLNSDEWGPNYEGSPGEFITFEVEAGEYYDMRCIDNASNEYFIWNVLIEEDGFRWLVEAY